MVGRVGQEHLLVEVDLLVELRQDRTTLILDDLEVGVLPGEHDIDQGCLDISIVQHNAPLLLVGLLGVDLVG